LKDFPIPGLTNTVGFKIHRGVLGLCRHSRHNEKGKGECAHGMLKPIGHMQFVRLDLWSKVPQYWPAPGISFTLVLRDLIPV